MSDAQNPGSGAEKSIEELKKELDEVGQEIDEARREVDAEHPKGPRFIDGAEGEDE
jgi:hypothetical protein